jgi:hypothetical protein
MRGIFGPAEKEYVKMTAEEKAEYEAERRSASKVKSESGRKYLLGFEATDGLPWLLPIAMLIVFVALLLHGLGVNVGF